MHLIIVEDLSFDQERLADLIQQDCDRHGEHVDLSFYGSGEDFLAYYHPKSCDGLLLDILLGGVNGIEAARKVRESEPRLPIIFTTNEQDYAVESFDVRPTDYLVKSLKPEEIARCMERLREYLSRPSSISLLEISGRGHSVPVDLPLDDILYAQCFDHIIQVNTVSGVYRTRCSFQDFTAQLPHTGRFCVCGRGLVINLSQAVQMKDDILLLKNGDTLAVPHRRKKEIQRAYAEWKFIRTREGAGREHFLESRRKSFGPGNPLPPDGLLSLPGPSAVFAVESAAAGLSASGLTVAFLWDRDTGWPRRPRDRICVCPSLHGYLFFLRQG